VQAPPQDPLLTWAGSESRSATGREMFDVSRLGNYSAQIECPMTMACLPAQN